MAILWDDVPPLQRHTLPWADWWGCPYAIESWPRGYRRCNGRARHGAPCPAHDAARRKPRPSQPEHLDNAVRSRIRREQRWRWDERTPPIACFRALTEGDIDAMPYVGVKIAARIREIRDTWDDERVRAFFDFPEWATPSPPDPAVFWAARPSILNVVGG